MLLSCSPEYIINVAIWLQVRKDGLREGLRLLYSSL